MTKILSCTTTLKLYHFTYLSRCLTKRKRRRIIKTKEALMKHKRKSWTISSKTSWNDQSQCGRWRRISHCLELSMKMFQTEWFWPVLQTNSRVNLVLISPSILKPYSSWKISQRRTNRIFLCLWKDSSQKKKIKRRKRTRLMLNWWQSRSNKDSSTKLFPRWTISESLSESSKNLWGGFLVNRTSGVSMSIGMRKKTSC